MGVIVANGIMRHVKKLEKELNERERYMEHCRTTEELLFRRDVLKVEINELKWEAWEQYQ